MEIDRPQLYYFLLPFTVVSLFLYAQILFEIYRKRGSDMHGSFFFRLTCSQSIFDIWYVLMYFVLELPQDWPQLYPLFLAMNDTIFPQLLYAQIFVCLVAQILGITIMSVSRMLLICHPALNITKLLKHLSIKRIVTFHFIIPIIYGCYITIGQSWRYYGFLTGSTRIARLGTELKINSQILCAFGVLGCIASTLCYTRIFLSLRKRPMRSWRNEVFILATSFVLFCSLCTLTAYFITIICILSADAGTQPPLYFAIRKHFYAFTFFISLANPWCLMLSSASIRKSVLRRSLPTCCSRLPLLASISYPRNEVANRTITSQNTPQM